MSYAPEIRREESPAAGIAVADLWLLPLLLLALIFEKFTRHLARLKDLRRSRPFRQDWQGFYPGLRQSEWAIRMFCFEGARQIILGEDLDLAAISFDPEPPESFCPPMPRSALAMHLRLEDLARFHADPERYIRRHAARVAARTGDDIGHSNSNPSNFLSGSNPSNPDPSNFQNAIPDFPHALPIAIRGPP